MNDAERSEQIEASAELRRMVLEGQYSDFGLAEPAQATDVWGLIMETGFPEGSYSLACLSDGSTSLYYSTGGGVIGAGQHADVNDAARAFVNRSKPLITDMAAAREFPLPAEAETLFYAMTTSGVYSIAVPEEELGEDRDEFSTLFFAAHEVIAKVREHSDL